MREETRKIFFLGLVVIIILSFVYVLYVGFFSGDISYSPRGSGENLPSMNHPCGNVIFCETSLECPSFEPCINGVCLI